MFKQQYSGKQVREAILLYENIKSFRKVASRLSISKSTIHRWYTRFHRVLHSAKRSKYIKRTNRKKYPTLIDDLKSLFATNDLNYISLQQILQKLNYKPSLMQLSRSLRMAKISRRRFSAHVRIKGSVNLDKVKEFATTYNSLALDSIVCIDETGFSNVGNVYYGYFRKGESPESVHVKQKLRRSSVVAISSSTVIHYKVQDKAYNTKTFYEFIQELVDHLPPTVTTILMDNISFHKSNCIKDFLKSRNLTILYIPAYSPKYDPIEEVFAQVKKTFRQQLFIGSDFVDSIHNSINSLKTREHVFLGSYNHTLQFCKNDLRN